MLGKVWFVSVMGFLVDSLSFVFLDGVPGVSMFVQLFGNCFWNGYGLSCPKSLDDAVLSLCHASHIFITARTMI